MNNSSDFYNFLFVIVFLVFISYFTNKKMEGMINGDKNKHKVTENFQNYGLSSTFRR